MLLFFFFLFAFVKNKLYIYFVCFTHNNKVQERGRERARSARESVSCERTFAGFLCNVKRGKVKGRGKGSAAADDSNSDSDATK